MKIIKKPSKLSRVRNLLGAVAVGVLTLVNGANAGLTKDSILYVSPEAYGGSDGFSGALSAGYRNNKAGAEAVYELGEKSQAVLKAGAFNVTPLNVDLTVAGYLGENYTGYSGDVSKSIVEGEYGSLRAGVGVYNFSFDESLNKETSSGGNVNLGAYTWLGSLGNSPVIGSIEADYSFGDENNARVFAVVKMPFGAKDFRADQDFFISHPMKHYSVSFVKGLEDRILDSIKESGNLATTSSSSVNTTYNGSTPNYNNGSGASGATADSSSGSTSNTASGATSDSSSGATSDSSSGSTSTTSTNPPLPGEDDGIGKPRGN